MQRCFLGTRVAKRITLPPSQLHQIKDRTQNSVTMCNISSLELNDVTILAALRGASGMLCAVINAVLLMSISIRSDRTKSVHRLLIYISLASLLALVVDIIQVESIGCDYNWHRHVCVAIGFFQQLTVWVLMLNVLWLIILICFHYWCPNYRSYLTPQKDVVIWVGIVVVSLIPSVVPIGTDAYGMNSAWCWIKSSRIAEQWVLWYSWMFACALAMVVLLSIALWYSERHILLYYESSRGINDSKQQMCKGEAKKIKTLILGITAYLIIAGMMVIAHHITTINTTLPFLVVIGIMEPMSILAVPMVFVTQLHSPKKNSNNTKREEKSKFPHRRGEKERSARGINTSYSTSSCHKKGNIIRNQDSGEDDFSGCVTESLLITDAERSELSSTI